MRDAIGAIEACFLARQIGLQYRAVDSSAASAACRLTPEISRPQCAHDSRARMIGEFSESFSCALFVCDTTRDMT